MPQLDILTYSSQLFWFIVFFISLYIFVSYFIVPKINFIKEIRKKEIDCNLSDATKARGKAQELSDEYDLLNKKSMLQVTEILEGEQSNLQRILTENNKNIDNEIHLLNLNAEKELSNQIKEYKDQLNDIILNYSKFLINKTSDLEVNIDELRSFIKKNDNR